MPFKLPAMMTLLAPIQQPNPQMSTAATNNRISHILELLGPAVLLPWPAASKGGDKKWKHLKLNDMNDHGHLTKLEQAGNIGVALGKSQMDWLRSISTKTK